MPSKRKRKRKRDAAASAPPPPKPQAVATAFAPLMQRAGVDRLAPRAVKPAANPKLEGARAQSAPRAASEAAPPDPRAAGDPANTGDADAPGLSQRELALLHRAYLGVERIDRPRRDRIERPRSAPAAAALPAHGEDDAARARLSDLVGGGVRFDVRWEDGFVQGVREGTSPKLLSRLRGSGFTAEAELDLHGLRAAEVERAVSQFVRAQQRRGRRHLLIITGKGSHSEHGVGVLGEALARALSGGGAAPLVLAFASAHARHGGQGAVAVLCR